LEIGNWVETRQNCLVFVFTPPTQTRHRVGGVNKLLVSHLDFERDSGLPMHLLRGESMFALSGLHATNDNHNLLIPLTSMPRVTQGSVLDHLLFTMHIIHTVS